MQLRSIFKYDAMHAGALKSPSFHTESLQRSTFRRSPIVIPPLGITYTYEYRIVHTPGDPFSHSPMITWLLSSFFFFLLVVSLRIFFVSPFQNRVALMRDQTFWYAQCLNLIKAFILWMFEQANTVPTFHIPFV